MKQFNDADLPVRAGILEHVQKFWPDSAIVEETWAEGPIQKNVPGFKVLKVKPNDPEQAIVYVTNGCFITEPMQHIRHEFFLIAPTEEPRHVEILTMLVNFHADERYRLDLGSVVNLGDPWLPGSKSDHLLISLPYTYGPDLEWLQLREVCVRFLWALPITAREAAFIELNGVDALEQKFDAVELDYINPVRSSTV